MLNKRIFLIDATAFCYRAFYAVKGLSTSFGQPTNAVYGFVNMLNKILKEQSPQFLAACFDVSRDTFRQKKFAQYKIQRPPMPEGLSGQIPLIKEIVSAYGIAIFEKEGYEADDIIATIVKKAKAKGLSATIISSDKDILQLVDKDTFVFSPYKDKGIYYDHHKVSERFGVSASQIPDIIALMGDDIDNIPGVKGIGEKTAAWLIRDYTCVEKLIAAAASIKEDRIREAILINTEKIKLNKELAVLDDNIVLDFDPAKLMVGSPDTKELFRLFKYLEFKKFLKGLPYEQEPAPQIDIDKISAQESVKLMPKGSELYLCARSARELFFYADKKFFALQEFGGEIKNALADPEIKKIGHDLKKTKVLLAQEGMALGGIFFDTMIAGYLLNPSKPQYALADLALDYLDQAAASGEDNDSQAIRVLVELKPALEKELEAKSLLGLFRELEMPLVEVLAEMELAGIRLDLNILRRLSEELEKKLVKLIAEIYEVSACQFNINSPKQLRGVLFERLGLPVIKRSKTGPSTDEEVLRKLAGKHALPKLLLEYRQLTKLKSTYIDALPALVDPKTGRVHTSFNQAGTETGRLSSSNPNLQNIPVKTGIGRKIRQAVIASADGYYLLSCDYSQIELRLLAHLSGDVGLSMAFKEGKDVHRATASLIYGLIQDDIDDDMREVAKRVNFGIVYGLTAYGLSRDLNIPAGEAQAFIEQYFLRYPGVKDYINAQIEKARKDGFVTTILGRRRYIPEINNKNQAIRMFAERQAVNTPIQGSASDLIKLAMISIHNDIKEKDLNARMILQIHDELLFDLPERELDSFCGLVKKRMETVLKLDVPVKVDMKKGKNWLEMEPAHPDCPALPAGRRQAGGRQGR